MASVLVIHPGDLFSTADVYDGLVEGLRAAGVIVHEARLDQGLDMTGLFAETAAQYPHSPEWARDAFALAAPRIVAQAAWLQPDAVIAVTGLKLHYSAPLTLRRMGIPTTVLLTESPYSAQERDLAQMYDAVFTNDRAALPQFDAHPCAQYLPHAYSPARHAPGPAEPDKDTDVFFVGTAFPERRALLGGVNWTGISRTISGTLWDQEDDRPLDVAAIRRGEVDPHAGVIGNTEAARWYRSARVNLNHHRTTTDYGSGGHIPAGVAQSLGPRAYEIAACGGFQLCDDSRPELFEVFGDAAASYRAGDSADLERQIRHWLTHPERRAETARMQHEAVREHSWHIRARQVLEVVLNMKASALCM